MQHYAVKTIENLASERCDWVAGFATAEMAERLAVIWAGARSEALRACASSALTGLARQCPRLLPIIAQQRSAIRLVRHNHHCNHTVAGLILEHLSPARLFANIFCILLTFQHLKLQGSEIQS